MPREHRQDSNRQLFRAVNEKIAELASRFETDTQSFICECARLGCTEQIEVPLEVYARVTQTPGAYLVRSGHEGDAEETVFGLSDYLIVVARDDAMEG